MEIELNEADFVLVADEIERIQLVGTERVLGGEEVMSTEEIVENLLPKALVGRIQKMIPSDFNVSQIKMQAELSGKAFGSGISGTFEVTFTRK